MDGMKTNPICDEKILQAAVAPDKSSYSPSIAKAILAIQFTDRQQREVSRLLDKNNEGTITSKERNKLESYIRVGNFLSLLKIKARISQSSRMAK